MMDLYLHMAAALLLVTGLILLLSRFFRKRQEKESFMKIMGYQSLGSKKGIAMVKIGPEVLIVGITATDVKLLKAVDPAGAKAPAGEAGNAAPLPETEARDAAVEKFVEAKAPRRPEQPSRVITADASGRLQRLRAMKITLKDALYAVK